MPKIIGILIVCLVFGASIEAQTIIGSWKLNSIILESDMAYSITEPVTLTLDSNGRFSGKGGCNDYVGIYSVKNFKSNFRKPQKIQFSDLIFCSAKKVCERASNTENAFFRSLKEGATIVLDNDALTIQNKASVIGKMFIQNTMTFVREDKPKL